jgi:transposase-like protein
MEALRGQGAGRHLISVDEKTGIQALERIAADQPMRAGQARRLEYEYERHGTTCLMAATDVALGNIVHHRLHPTRTETDFLLFVKGVVAQFPADEEVILLADQLNTHLSASLVEWIAQQIDFQGDLGKKNYRGILKNQPSRRAFLENPEHRIRFVYTPKHCSWLNPIENWFGKLQRHVVRYGNFSSIRELENNIESYIAYYNNCLAKPLNWKFEGFSKSMRNTHNNCIKT